MPTKKYSYETLLKLYEYLQENPFATYAQMENHLGGEVKANSLLRQLKRNGSITTEDVRENGRFIGTKKICVRKPYQ